MSQYMISPFQSGSINTLIEAGKALEINNQKLHYQATITGQQGNDETFIMNAESILERYYDFLMPHVEVMQLDEFQAERYRWQPRRLSLDLYGTTELWALLLRINNKMSMLDFTDTTVKVFKSSIIDFIREVSILDAERIRDNKHAVYK